MKPWGRHAAALGFLSWAVSLLETKPAAGPTTNTVVRDLCAQAQQELVDTRRQPWHAALGVRQQARARQIRAELAAGRLRHSSDHYHAALGLQHSDSMDDLRLANALAWIAHELADRDTPSRLDAAWLYAASWDRLQQALQAGDETSTSGEPREPVTPASHNARAAAAQVSGETLLASALAPRGTPAVDWLLKSSEA